MKQDPQPIENRKIALITGASSGIGYALSHEFANANYDIIAVGRELDKLKQLQKECSQVTVFCLPLDLTIPEAIPTLMRFIHENRLQIHTLVNNAGFGVWGEFVESDLGLELKLVELSIRIYLELNKALIPNMIARKQGAILNIGSVYSFIAVPKQSVYAATKAFILSHTLALRCELRRHHIKVCVSCPGITETLFRKRKDIKDKKSIFSMSAAQVAAITFKKLQQDQAIIIPGIHNKMFVSLCQLIPITLTAKLIIFINRKRQLHLA